MAAPLLNNAARLLLNSVTEDDGPPAGAVGTLVASLVGLMGAGGPANVADTDPGAVTGIAITGTNSTNGTWWYSLDNGATWLAVGARSTASSLLLAADGGTRLYFQPNANFSGTVADGITFLAWDRSSGSNGDLASTATTGGNTAFSVLSDTASIAVSGVNDGPVTGVTVLPAAQQNAAVNLGGKVSIADADAGSNAVRVTLSVSHGTLDIDTSVPGGVSAGQVSGDTSGTVLLTATPAQVNATLAATSGLSYRGEHGYSGSDTLSVQVSDQGNSGAGGSQTGNASATLTVNAASASNTLSVSQASALKPGGDVDGDGAIDPGDTVLVTVSITNNSTTTSATSVALNQALSGLTDTTYNASPIAVADSYNVVGNTLLEAGGGGATVPALKVANGVFANDVEFNGDTFTLSKVQGFDFNGAAVATDHGKVTMRSDGSFSYQPNANYTGADSFTYTIRDKGLDGIAGNADDLSTTATVNLTISGKVWYLDGNAAAGGDGTSSKPFNAATAAVSTGLGAGDYVYVQNNVAGNLTLKANQHLVGTGEALVVGGNTLAVATGTRSTLTGDSSAALTVGTGNDIAGITIAGSGGITGNNFGTVTINNVAINSTTQALSLTDGAFSGTGFVSTSSAGGANNVYLKTMTGTINLGTGTLSGATAAGVLIDGGSGNIDYDGAVSHSANAAAVSVSNRGSGTIDFDGAVSATAGSDGVVLSNNTGTTINFDGGVTINSTSGGFHATATGGAIGTSTVNVTGSGNTISSGTTTALRIVDTKIGSNDLSFQSISSNGAANGIYLQNTGTAGNLNVTGDATTNKNSSGGTITNSTGAGATDGTGIYLSNTRDVVLEQMSISNNSTDGIYGQNLTNLTLDRLTISGNGNAVQEAGVQIGDAYTLTHGLTGTLTVNNTTVTGSAEDNLRLWNNNGAATVNITNSTFSNNSALGNDGVLVESVRTANLWVNVTNSTFTGNRGDQFQAVAGISDGLSGNLSLTFTGNNLGSGGRADVVSGGGGMTVAGGGGGSGNPLWNGVLNYNISNNTINGAVGTALYVGLATSDTGAVLNGFVQGNTIGNAGVNSGSTQSSGIYVSSVGKGTHTVKVSGNNVANTYGPAMSVYANQGSSKTNLTAQGNTLSMPSGAMSHALYMATGNTSTDTAQLKIDLSGNTITPSSGYYGIYARPRFSTSIAAEGYTGTAGDTVAFSAYLASQNGNTSVTTALTAPATVTSTTGTVPEPSLFSTTGPAAAVALPEPAAAAPDPVTESTPAQLPSQQPAQSLPQPVALDGAALGRIVEAAIDRWAAAGASAEQLAAMRAVTLTIDDLAGLRVGASEEGAVVIDADAAGYGWFVDATPAADEEFAATASPTRLQADGAQVPAGSIDLLTVVMHELGHQIGLADSYLATTMDNLMSGYMPSDERRLPAPGQAEGAPGHGEGDDSFAIGSLNLGTIAPGQTVVVQTIATVGSQTGQLVANPSNNSTVTSSFGSYTTNTTVTTVDSLELGGTIFNDLNGSGSKDGADAGIDGVAVQLLGDNGTTPGAYDSGDTVIASTTSANGGAYRFTGLAPGNYIVQVQESNFNGGAPLDQLISLPGNPDPDGTPDVAGDDNGERVTGKGLVSLPVTIGYDSETTADASGKRDINDRLDFGVRNEAPAIGNLSGDSASYTRGGAAVLLDSGTVATLTDANNTSLQGGFLRVSVSANGAANEDVLGLSTSGTVSLSSGMNPGSVVSVSGAPVGTIIWPGSGGVDLVIGFGNATPAQAATLLGALTYRNTNTVQPSAATRTIGVTLDDGLGGVASGITTSVQVLSINSAPVVDLNGAAAGTGAAATYLEGGWPTQIAPAATVTDTDSADFAGGRLTVAFSANGTGTDLLRIDNTGTGAGEIGVAGSNVTYGGTVIGTFSGGSNGDALTINFTGAAATPAAVQQLMRNIAYADIADNPSPSTRSIAFTLVDGDGTANGGADTGSATATGSVTAINDWPLGSVVISGTPTQGQTLTAYNALNDPDGMGTVSYQWKADGVNISGATGTALVLGQAQVGKAITVVASYTDGGNTAESVASSPTTAVANVNDAPTGGVAISGTAVQGQILTASNTLADLDGMGTISYQWKADGVNITGATGSTFVLGQAQVGKAITVVASYTDGGNTSESVTSGATTAVTNTNDAPTGSVSVTGTAKQGETLTVSNNLADLDGLGTISYQWKADGADIAGATGTTLVLAQSQVGKQITAVARYTDGFGATETVSSSATAAVINVNDAATGGVTIAGTPAQGQTLTASNTLADADGMGTVSYQWKADGANIAGATASTLVLDQAQVGKAITVAASFTDGGGTTESVASSATTAVANINDAPTGSVTITGTAAQNQTLAASNTLGDLDGIGTVSYQWKADGVDIAGATGSTLVLAQAQVGKQISVVASYTDGFSHAETATSAATVAVANANDAPTGAVTITGTATQGQTLTAANTLADLDGMGTISYQWKADGVNIAGAASSLVLGQAQVGKAITVVASYTDGGNTAESVASSATTAVANVNDAPTGGVSITGTAAQGQTLTATNTLADLDGLGTISYQWKADGANIATGATLVLGQAHVGKAITVVASYTDNGGASESAASAATAAVTNTNDAPTGSVTVTGTARQGETLTVSNNLADVDGLGAISYQWKADGAEIAGATGATLVLAQAQVGKQITAVARYTDGFNTTETVSSSATAAVINVNDAATGGVTVAGAPTQGQTLTASHTLADADGMGAVSYQWKADGANIAGATGSTLVLGQAQVGKAISVVASFTDGGNTAESATSTATTAVANINDAPTGSVTITGTLTEYETLTASNTLADADGLGTISYQWRADGADIAGATGSTLVLAQAHVGKQIGVVARYADGFGVTESVASAATTPIADFNNAPTGSVTITGTPTQGQTLNAAHTLADLDGLGTVSWQWRADGANIAGATGSTLVLGQAQVGKAISVVARYTDGGNVAESVVSSATTAVANVNDAPTGGVSITGTAAQGQTLTAASTLADLDGLGTISYQWKADGANIATGATLVLGQAHVGKAITVVASYTDNGGAMESATSATTTAVANTNDAPTGSVTVTGTARQGETLTVSNNLADADGLGAVSYQWKADGADIAGATGATLVLAQAQVGKQITAVARYTDGFNATETVISSATAAVANVNDAATGGVAISGTPTQGQTLTASNTLADADGMGTVSYQWKADGVNITGATSSTLVLGQAQVGKQITVVASFTDGGNTVESATSTATTAVANINDAPTGNITISGTVAERETLTAHSTLADADGLGTISYQWRAAGADIAGATGSTLVLAQSQVGKQISVVARYTDGFGTLETVASTATPAVANFNNPPTGSVTISGTATQGQTLSAANTLADLDGLGTISYQWKADGADIAGAIASTLVLGQSHVGKAISVVARYTDGGNAAESVASSATAAVANVNDAPTGSLLVNGRPAAGQTLTVSNQLADLDVLGTMTYQWRANGADIAGATGTSFTLAAEHIGKTISVVARYTDGGGTAETVASSATAAVVEANRAPTGSVTISGTPTQGQQLSASHTLADPDGLGTVGWQWQANGADIAGATGSTLVLAQDQVGKTITVLARYTDQQGSHETVASAATVAVANVNDAPTGGLLITGTAALDQTLSVTHNLADPDGLGAISYQWRADGADIAGATGASLVLTQAQVGKAITVVARYTDHGGFAETVSSAATAPVANVNHTPTGSVTITGRALQGDTLSANANLADANGVGTLRFQWQADGADIAGATGSTMVLGQAHVGKLITVVARYTDSGGTPEQIASAPTAAVANVNDAPQGTVTISGSASEGDTLVATHTLTDADGIGAVAWQWRANSVDIAGATGARLVLGTGEVGKAISVVARYTDGGGTAEQVASAASALVEALPPPPPPVVVHKEDGVEVAVRTENKPDGTVWQKIEVPVVTNGRQEQVGNTNAADIGLVKSSAGDNLLTAVVPSGVGLSASGSSTVQTGQAGQQTLASSVGQYAGLGSNALSGYANTLPQEKPLLVQTIVVSTAGTGTPATPLSLGGSGANVERALVIDTSASTGGAQVKLDNVGFAAVVGKASIEAGSGNQHIVADDKAQQIKAGDGNDVVRAGGGNDVLDGGTGNDQIDGGEGVDVVQLTGSGREDYALRFENGQLVVAARGNGADGVDTLSNVEKLRFADAPADTSPAGSLERIYESLLGRDADPGGDAWWLGQHQAGLPMHEIATAILNSTETSSSLGRLGNAQFVDTLYQRTLGRPADEAGRTFWVQQLEQGTLDRANLLLALVDSNEKLASTSRPVELDFNQSDVAALIRMYYASFGRAPDESGINFWIAQSEAGLGLNEIAAAFVSSAEQGGTLTDSQFVAELYRDALHREASQAELSAWIDALAHGGTRASVMMAIAQSEEMVKLVGSVTTSLPAF